MNKNVLEQEINLIQNQEIKNFTKSTLNNTPNYFFIGMASSTGKYHPTCTCIKSGLLIHVKRTIYIANRLCDGWGIKGIDRDIVLSATILHDIAKVPSPKEDPKITYADYENHPVYAHNYFIISDEFNDEILQKINNCICFHMGLWTPQIIKKEIKDYTLLELCVYTADYIATTKDLITPVDNTDGIPCQCDGPLKNNLSTQCGNCGLELK
jgi:HD superfamily phosphohydrolase YqeK